MSELSPEDFELIVLGWLNSVITLTAAGQISGANARAVKAAREITDMAQTRLQGRGEGA